MKKPVIYDQKLHRPIGVGETLDPSAIPVSSEDGNALTINEDGIFVPESGGGIDNLCEAIEDLPVRKTLGEKPRILVNDGEDCFLVETSPSGIFSDVRAGIQASPSTAIAGDTGRVSFTARNVSATEVSKVRLIATLPSQSQDDPGFEVVGEPSFSNPTGATITKVGEGVWDIEPMVGGAVVTVSYTLKYIKDGTYMFSSTVEMLDENAIDFDEADDYASAGVVVRLREDPNVDPEQCPAMDVRAEVDGVEYPMTLIQQPVVSTLVQRLASENPKSLLVVDVGTEVVIKTEVPVTLLNYSSLEFSSGAHFIKDQIPYGARRNSQLMPSPEAAPTNIDVSVEASPDAKSFVVKAADASGRGAVATLALRPGAECKWQHFAILFGSVKEKGVLTFSGDAPPFTKTDSYSPSRPAYIIEAANGGSVLASGTYTSSSEINLSEEVLLKPKTGQAYSFNVKASGPADLGTTSATGNISIQVVNSKEWNVTINPTASSADNVKLGPLTFEFED